MIAVIASCFVVVIWAWDRSVGAHQISHLHDWTTIPKFELTFDYNPSSKNQDFASPQLPLIDYTLTLENGTSYICSIPNVASVREEGEDDGPDEEPTDELSSQQLRSKIQTNFEIMTSGKCVRKSEGFWLFEVCPFKEARQIHTNGDRELLSFSLGKFHRSYWDEDGSFVQEFQHGTDGRSCKAMFSCGPKQNDKVASSFIDAREPTPLNYLMKLESPTLCTREQKSTTPYALLYGLNSKCIFLNKGWWSYEFCHLGYVRQFHSERVKAESVEGNQDPSARFQTVTTASFILGRFPGNGSDSDYVNNRTKLVTSRESSSQSYFSQMFSEGSDCDLTGKKRETEIRFLCNRNSNNAKFSSVTEVKTCSYLVEIEVPTICSHPSFSTKEHVTYNIQCRTQQETLNSGSPEPIPEKQVVQNAAERESAMEEKQQHVDHEDNSPNTNTVETKPSDNELKPEL